VSAYFYLVCLDCGEYCDGASRLAGGGVCHLADSDKLLPSFLVVHAQCRDGGSGRLQVASEHAEEFENGTWREWTLARGRFYGAMVSGGR
jgi:hypothetical protein